MIHFLYLIGFALLVSLCFGVFASGDTRQRIVYGVKIFFQFVVISLALSWIFYFLT